MNDHQVLPYCVQVYWEESWCMSWSECAMAFYAACQWQMMVQYCCGSGTTNKLFCMCFLLWHEANEVILSIWLYYLLYLIINAKGKDSINVEHYKFYIISLTYDKKTLIYWRNLIWERIFWQMLWPWEWLLFFLLRNVMTTTNLSHCQWVSDTHCL